MKLIIFLALFPSAMGFWNSFSRYQTRCTIQIFAQLNDEVELAKIFCRLADDYLLLDVPGAGSPEMMNCCHGGCDNCAYSRVFDQMESGKPKWIPLYTSRTLIDGRQHKSSWSNIFGKDNAREISKFKFVSAIKALQARNSLGGLPTIKLEDAPSDGVLLEFWDALYHKANNTEDKISSDQMVEALKQFTGESHGATWMQFKEAFIT